MSLAPGGLLAGRYELDHPIASGGFGDVWRGTDVVLARPVAIKLLRAEFCAETSTLARFRDEAQNAGALAHENIVRVFDYDDLGPHGLPFLVMEFVDGPTLEAVLAAGPMPPARVMDVVAQVASALHAAHEAGLVHRDIKPQNILLCSDGQVKLTDFGISRAIESTSLTLPGTVFGTPEYLAPERASGALSTPASDLYALGILAYQCLTGTMPFTGPPVDVVMAHQNMPLPPLPDAVPAGVAALVSRLTAKDPAVRPESAADVAAWARALRGSLIPDAAIQPAESAAGQTPAGATWAGDGSAAAGAAGTPVQAHGARRRPRQLLPAVAAIAAVLAVVGAVTLIGSGPSHPATTSDKVGMVQVDAAALRGLPLAVVRRTLTSRGLRVLVRRQASRRERPGLVLAVRPSGRVPSGSTVVVVAAMAPGPGHRLAGAPSHGSGRRHGRARGHGTGRAGPSQPSTSAPPSTGPSGSPAPSGSPSAPPSPAPSQTPSPAPSPAPSGNPSPPASPAPSGLAGAG